MKFEITIDEKAVTPEQLNIWKEDLMYGSFTMTIGEIEDGEYLVTLEPIYYRDFGRVIDSLITLSEEGW